MKFIDCVPHFHWREESASRAFFLCVNTLHRNRVCPIQLQVSLLDRVHTIAEQEWVGNGLRNVQGHPCMFLA